MNNKVVEEGQLEGSFNGFNNRDTIFKFVGGGKWRQAEYKYCYYYAYMPNAKIISKNGCYILVVEDMDETVEVLPL